MYSGEMQCQVCHWLAYLIYATMACLYVLFFFSSRRRHTRFDCDWSSDVCSSDLRGRFQETSAPKACSLLACTGGHWPRLQLHPARALPGRRNVEGMRRDRSDLERSETSCISAQQRP